MMSNAKKTSVGLNLAAQVTEPALKRNAMCQGLLALGISTVALAAAPLYASDVKLDTIQVEDRAIDSNPYAEEDAPYKAKVSGDSRRTKDLAETPQTMVVLTQEAIQDSGETDLKQILVKQPGITLGTGENGNAFGDRYIIRGHEARSDVFVDGIRDPGMTTRESFAVEQVEITKGPSSTFAGRGATGGAVNSVTKQASTDYDVTTVQGAIGSDNHRRVTVDSNMVLSPDTAVRINALYGEEDVPEREPADRQRRGLAVSATKQVSDRLKVTGDYYYLNAKDKPDLGNYIVSGGDPVDDLPAYVQDEDFLNSSINTVTLRADFEVNNDVTLQNSMRYGKTKNGYVVTGARGYDATFAGATDTVASATLSTHQGWQDVQYFVNQSNVLIDKKIAGKQHNIVLGVEYSDLGVTNGVYDYTVQGASNCQYERRGNLTDGYCITDADGNYLSGSEIGSLLDRDISKGAVDADYRIKTVSAYAMDSVDVTDKLTLSGGVRVDKFDYVNEVGSGTSTEYAYDDVLVNGHAGVVYEIADNVNVYANYGTAANINGGESDLGTNCGYGGLCVDSDPSFELSDVAPEKTENIEIGTKWNINDGKLLLTAAAFQITKDDVMEGDGYASVGSINSGKNQVKGIELGLVGNLTDKLSAQVGVAMMESEVLESATADNVGKRLSNFADDSAHVQLSYKATPKVTVGGAATYSSEAYAGQPDSAAGDTYKIPAYTYLDLFAKYKHSEKLSADVKLGNVSNKDYYTAAYRSGAFAYKGDARNLKVGMKYKF